MKKYFRMPRRVVESMSDTDNERMLTRFLVDAIVDNPGLLDLMQSETGAILRVTVRKRFSDIYHSESLGQRFTTYYAGQELLIVEVDTEVVKPAEPNRHSKSKDEILMELKILTMTYISDLWRDFAKLDKPMESTNSWKHIEKFIEDTFYNTPEVTG